MELDSGTGYEMRVENRSLECAVVYRQILIGAELQTVKRGQKFCRANWGSPLRRRWSVLDCRAIEGEGKHGGAWCIVRL
jgi:hypothetical protein